MGVEKILDAIKADCEARTVLKADRRFIECDGCRWETVCGRDMYYVPAYELLQMFIEIYEKRKE